MKVFNIDGKDWTVEKTINVGSKACKNCKFWKMNKGLPKYDCPIDDVYLSTMTGEEYCWKWSKK